MNNSDLHNMLGEDQLRLDELSEVLQAERVCLERRDLQNLTQLLQKKQQLLAEIESNDFNRRKLLQQAGAPVDRTSLSQLRILLKDSTDTTLTTLLETIENKVRHCREMSETNSIIVHRSRLNTQKALDIMRGVDAVSGLYTSHGSTQAGTVKRDLGNV
jgi:flagellar biosynthesis protein FlgN